MAEIKEAIENRRVKLGHADIPENAEIKETALDKTKTKIEKIGTTLDEIELQVGESDSPAIKEIAPEIEELRAAHKSVSEKQAELDELMKSVNDRIAAEGGCEASDEPVLVALINDIRKLGSALEDLIKELNDLEKGVKDTVAKINGLD